MTPEQHPTPAYPAEALPEPLARPDGALTDLARAFHANARALEGVGTLQSELLDALKRGDRSELVLASAQGLNESFRQLAVIQRALLTRLEAPPPQPAGSRLVPLLLLGLAAVVVLATWAILSAWRDFAASQPDPRAMTEHAAQLLQAGRDEAAASARDDARRLEARVTESDERVRTLQERLDTEREAGVERQREISAKEAELDALRRQAIAAQNEALKKLSLEDEVRELTAQLAVAEPRQRALAEELEAERRENGRLRRRLAGAALGLEEEPEPPPVNLAARSGAASGTDAGEPLPPVRGAAPPTQPPAPREAEGTRDPAILKQVQGSLNTLLEVSRGTRPDHWRLKSVDGVTQDRLRGVVAERFDAAGRLVETVEAREAFVWVDRAAQRALIEFRQGVRTVNGVRADFHTGGIQSVVAEGQHTALFMQSGLTLVGLR